MVNMVPVVRMKNPRWNGWAVYLTWMECADAIRDFLEDDLDNATPSPGSTEPFGIDDEFIIEFALMSQEELDAMEDIDI